MKTQEASQIKHVQNQRSQQEQIHIQSQFSNQVKHDGQMTVKTLKSENDEYRYDAKEKGNNSYSGSKQEKKNQEDEELEKASKNPIKTGRFDVLI